MATSATSATLIPARNAERLIAQAVTSALAQTGTVLVCDDASGDRTAERAAAAGAMVLRESGRVGSQKARNRLLATALDEGWEWLQFLDADDVLLPGKVAAQIAAGWPVSYTRVIRETWEQGRPVRHERLDTGRYPLLESLLRHKCNPPTSAFLFHRSVFERVRWDEGWAYMQDRKLALDLLRAGFAPRHLAIDGAIYRWGWSPRQLTQQPQPLLRQHRQRFLAEAQDWARHLSHSTPRHNSWH